MRVELGPAGPGDAPAIARVEVETWRTTYAGMLADSSLLAMSPERQARLWAGPIKLSPRDTWVARTEEGIVGFGYCGPQRDHRLPFAGEVYMLYVLPDAQGLGIGRQLLRAMFARLEECCLHSALIWVLRQNPSRFFYERLGGRLACQRNIAFGGEQVPALGYGWGNLVPTPHRPKRSSAR